MTTRTTAPPHEPSAWMRERVDKRIRQATPHCTPGVVVITGLGRLSEPDTAEDRTCDRCRVYVEPGRLLMTLVIRPHRHLVIVGGLCEACWELETPGRTAQ